LVSGASFSPDGTTVVFALDSYAPAHLDPGIYLIGADGGVPRLLLAPGRRYSPELGNVRTELSLPTFSPDGTQIAYIDGNGDWGNSLRVMNADGTDVHVWDGSDAHLLGGESDLGGWTMGLSWSPDGTRLAVGVRYFEPSGIYVVEADGSGLTLTIPGGVNPHWSPDGTRISFEHDPLPQGLGGLQIADPDGRHVQIFGYRPSGPWTHSSSRSSRSAKSRMVGWM
jgi:Tol biopolymer transport system component